MPIKRKSDNKRNTLYNVKNFFFTPTYQNCFQLYCCLEVKQKDLIQTALEQHLTLVPGYHDTYAAVHCIHLNAKEFMYTSNLIQTCLAFKSYSFQNLLMITQQV